MEAEKGIRLLNVEACDLQRQSLTQGLSARGFTVTEAATGCAALQIIKEDPPDLVLLEVDLPDIDGLEVCRAIKADPETSSIPVVQLSRRMVPRESRFEGYHSGSEVFLTGPVNSDVLAAVIQALATTARLNRRSRAAHAILPELIDNAPFAVNACTLEGLFLMVNSGWEQSTGYSREHAIGRSIEELFSARAARVLREGHAQALADGRTVVREETTGSAERLRFLRTLQFPVFNGKGGPPFVATISVDVTAQRAAEEQLRVSDERFRRLFEGNSIGIVLGEEAHLIEANDLFLSLIGYTRQELIENQISPAELTPSEYAGADQRAREQLLETGRCELYEKELIRKDGSRAAVLTGSSLLQSSPRLKWIAFVLDLSERKRTELRVAQQHKLETIGRLARGVAQRINNASMAVLGNISLASETLEEDSPALRFMQAASLAANQMADLPRDLLAYSGRGLFPVEALDLSNFIRKIEPLIRRMLPAHIELILQLDHTAPIVAADGMQMQTVVLNLVSNAVEASSQASGIIISTSSRHFDERSVQDLLGYERVQPGLYSCVHVRDSGCGMDANVLSRIFDPFFSTKDASRGLGLSTVLGILRSHRAGIQVSSIPGKGSVFTICLPAMEG